MHHKEPGDGRSWCRKFRDAGRGCLLGTGQQSSFRVHAIVAVLVCLSAALLRMSVAEWSLLLLCITIVLTAEMFNSAIEWLAQAIDREHNEQLGGALDIASGAVLVSSIGAASVGLILFIHRLAIFVE